MKGTKLMMNTSNKTSLYYEIYGDGIPLVMLHGWGVDHRILSGCMEPLFSNHPARFQRIYIDLPGMGKSKANPHIRTSDHMLDALFNFLDEIIPGQRYMIMGESYGGYLARGMVKKRASQIAGLILLCPLIYPGYRKGKVEPLCVMEKDEAFLNRLSKQEKDSFECMNVILTEKVWNKYKSDIYDAVLHQDTHFLTEILDGNCSFNVDELEEPFDAPCLIITGKQDTEVGYRDQFEIMDLYTCSTYIAINRAGHSLQIEQPELLTAIISSWLEDNMKSFVE